MVRSYGVLVKEAADSHDAGFWPARSQASWMVLTSAASHSRNVSRIPSRLGDTAPPCKCAKSLPMSQFPAYRFAATAGCIEKVDPRRHPKAPICPTVPPA